MAIVAAYAAPHPPLIVHAVGQGREQEVQATVDAYREVGRRVAAHRPDTIVITSPHAPLYADYLHVSPGSRAYGDFARFGAPGAAYEVAYDRELVAELCRVADERGLPLGTLGSRRDELDHGTLVPLSFIQPACAEAGVRPRYVRIGLSGLGSAVHYRAGMAVAEAARRLARRVVLLASGDLSHKLLEDGPYGFAPEGPKFDERVCEALGAADFLTLLDLDPGLCERAAECGLRSFQIMAGALDRTPVVAELLSHEGPFGVGYGVAAFEPAGPEGSDETRALLPRYEDLVERRRAESRDAEDPWVRLARASLEAWVAEGRQLSPSEVEGLPSELASQRAGCFVSLKKDGRLRGCIGTIAATQGSLALEICANAISAGTRDPRFDPVTEEELPALVYDVDVLGEPEEVASTADLDPRRYGVIVSDRSGRRGLLLPDLDGVDTVEEQLGIAARKGGVDLGGPDVRIQRFEVTRHL